MENLAKIRVALLEAEITQRGKKSAALSYLVDALKKENFDPVEALTFLIYKSQSDINNEVDIQVSNATDNINQELKNLSRLLEEHEVQDIIQSFYIQTLQRTIDRYSLEDSANKILSHRAKALLKVMHDSGTNLSAEPYFRDCFPRLL